MYTLYNFKTAHNESNWEIDTFKNYDVFNVPVRRAMYSRVTNSFEFPKKNVPFIGLKIDDS